MHVVNHAHFMPMEGVSLFCVHVFVHLRVCGGCSFTHAPSLETERREKFKIKIALAFSRCSPIQVLSTTCLTLVRQNEN